MIAHMKAAHPSTGEGENRRRPAVASSLRRRFDSDEFYDSICICVQIRRHSIVLICGLEDASRTMFEEVASMKQRPEDAHPAEESSVAHADTHDHDHPHSDAH